MSLLGLIVLICVLGFIAWLVNAYIPIPAPFKTLIMVILIVIAVLVTLNAFGLLGNLDMAVPRVR